MSEVTNSATTFSLPAGQAEGKLKLLPLQHLREEEKTQKTPSWWEGEREREKKKGFLDSQDEQIMHFKIQIARGCLRGWREMRK